MIEKLRLSQIQKKYGKESFYASPVNKHDVNHFAAYTNSPYDLKPMKVKIIETKDDFNDDVLALKCEDTGKVYFIDYIGEIMVSDDIEEIEIILTALNKTWVNVALYHATRELKDAQERFERLNEYKNSLET